MKSPSTRQGKSPKTRKQKVQMVLSCVVLFAILFLVYKSWRSSQTLAFGLSGTWISLNGNFTVACVGGSWYESTCQLSSPYAYTGEVLVAPLSDGNWVWTLPHNGGSSYFFHHSRGRLRITDGEQRGRLSKGKATTFRRAGGTQQGNFFAALRAKSQYIVPLFLLVASYKWVQVAFFGKGLTSTSRRQRLIGRRRAAASR